MKELVKRWRPDQIVEVASALKAGKNPQSPFGLTDSGLADLRGLLVKEPLILNGQTISGLDLSFASVSKLLCIQCEVTECTFDYAKMALLSNSTSIANSSFREAGLLTSGSAGSAKFLNCDFRGSNLTGSTFKEGEFDGCDFSKAILGKIEFGVCRIKKSLFSGTLEKCFFRGLLEECDLREATFLDCAFYGAELRNCQLSDHALLFKDWQNTRARICEGIESSQLSNSAKSALKKWCSVWSQLNDVMREELIDREDLANQEGVGIGEELYRYLKTTFSTSA